MPLPVAAVAAQGLKKAGTKALGKFIAKKAVNKSKKRGPGPGTKLLLVLLVLAVIVGWYQMQFVANTMSTLAGAVSGDQEQQAEENECTDGDTTVPAVAGSSNVDTAMKTLIKSGLKPHQAAGLVGNWQVESTPKVDPKAKNAQGYTGIAQWDPDHRWPRAERYAKAKNLDPMKLATQLRYAMWELGIVSDWQEEGIGPYGKEGASLKKSTSSDTATELIFDYYEGPGDSSLGKRQGYAKALAKKYKGQGGGDTSTVRNVNDVQDTPRGESGAWRVPTQTKYTLGQGMGADRGDHAHDGVDLNLIPEGGPILAASSGTVRIAGSYYGMGTTVAIDHPGGIRTYYAHLRKLDPSMKVGATVRGGQRLGWEGNTGDSKGAHLHYGVKKSGIFIDPITFMKSKGAPFDGKPGGGGTTGTPTGDESGCDNGDTTLSVAGAKPPGKWTKSASYKKHVNFQQCDPVWGKKTNDHGVSICASSCGPFSMANIIWNFGHKVDPEKLAMESSKVGITSSGSSGEKVVAHFAPKFGLKHEVLPTGDKAAIIEALKKGGQVMIGGRGGPPLDAGSGHIISLWKYNESDDTFLVSDPGRKKNNLRAWPVDKVLASTDYFGSGRTNQKAIAVYNKDSKEA